jgi:glutathione S-transferase
MALLEESLADGRPFLGGEAAGHADLAFYMLIWFQQMRGGKASDYGERIAVWASRVAAIGHGSSEDWTAQQAIELAKTSEPLHDHAVLPNLGFQAGDQVSVSPEGPDPATVEGTLIGLDDRCIILERQTKAAGKVHVHFPRFGQVLTATD